MVHARREVRIIPKGDGEAGVSAVTKEAHGIDEFMLLGAESSFQVIGKTVASDILFSARVIKKISLHVN